MLAVWILTPAVRLLFESILKPRASQLVYRKALVTMEHRRARRKPVGAVGYWLVTPNAIAPCPRVFNLAASKDVDARCDERSSYS
ncbi:hypothetical protein [Microcoleus sp. BROC3]|uniref:hypothetical protein n=1 Tax=Microcoleus sp. BROC3 TaxID=3055323 RepID=UPI002FD073C5